MDFSHKYKKSRVSASDEITPSRSVLSQGRRVLTPKSDPTLFAVGRVTVNREQTQFVGCYQIPVGVGR